MRETTRTQLRTLAAGESYTAFKSTARVCGFSTEEIEAFWQDAHGDEQEIVLDVRDSGAELRSDQGWLTSTAVEEVRR